MNEVLLLTAAGASTSFGYPTTAQFLARFEDEYGKSGLLGQIRTNPMNKDIEHVLEILDKLVEVGSDSRLFTFLESIAPGIKLPESERIDKWPILVAEAKDLRERVIHALFSYYEFDMRKKQEILNKITPIFDCVCDFNLRFAGESKVVLFTLNYDQVMEKFCEFSDRFVCVDGFVRKPKSIEWVWEPNIFKEDRPGKPIPVELYKLHGSLNWRRLGTGSVSKLATEERVSGRTYSENVVLYPGDFKDLVSEPHISLFNMYQEYLKQSSVCIVIGYSFRDEHINRELVDFAKRDSRTLIIVSPHASASIEGMRSMFGSNSVRMRLTPHGKEIVLFGGNSSLVVLLDSNFENAKLPGRLAQTIKELVRVFVIDYSKPYESLPGDRVLVVGDRAYHMGKGYDQWAAENGVMVVKGRGPFHEHLRALRIIDTGSTPPSTKWLDEQWRESRLLRHST